MSMYRSYLLKNNFWAKKGNEKSPGAEKVFIKHDSGVGGIYAIIENDKKGVKIMLLEELLAKHDYGYTGSWVTDLQIFINRCIRYGSAEPRLISQYPFYYNELSNTKELSIIKNVDRKYNFKMSY